MRSELIISYITKNSLYDCRFCRSLGYISNASLSKDEQIAEIFKKSFSVSTNITYHISGIQSAVHTECNQLLQEKIITYVGCTDCISKFPDQTEKIAVIAKNKEDFFLISKKNDVRKIYFHVDIQQSQVLDLINISKLDAEKIYFFSTYRAFNNLSAYQQLLWLKFANTFKSKFGLFNYETPNSHDIIDQRNVSHLNWIFSPNIVFKSNSSNSRKIKISIIIPFFNRMKFLVKVINSLRNQSLDTKYFEILLMDDGSDESEYHSLIGHLNDLNLNNNLSYYYINRDIQIKSFKGNRVGPVRNLGARESKGEILLFLDSDIILPADYLEKILSLHQKYSVIMPQRQYLNKKSSEMTTAENTNFISTDFMDTDWDRFLNQIFESNSWFDSEFPWKYFMTYCLSIKKVVFLQTGGFRTNYISYGYEDIDLGYRLCQISNSLALLHQKVFHLYHFNKSNEYDLTSFIRYFQLAMTARVFVMQNMPTGNHDLEKMVQFRTLCGKLKYLLSYWRPVGG